MTLESVREKQSEVLVAGPSVTGSPATGTAVAGSAPSGSPVTNVAECGVAESGAAESGVANTGVLTAGASTVGAGTAGAENSSTFDSTVPTDRFWRDMFLSEPPRLDRFHEYSRATVPSYRRDEATLTLHSSCWQRLNQWSEREGISPHTVIAAAWIILLSRATDETDICFGAILSKPEVQLVPLRLSLEGLSARSVIYGVASYLESPQTLPPFRWPWFHSQIWLRYSSRRPLPCQIAVSSARPSAMKVSHPALNGLLRKVDAVLSTGQVQERGTISITYDAEIFSAHGMKMRLLQLEQLLRAICDQPDLPFEELDFSGQDDRDSYRLVNRTDVRFPTEETIDQLFSFQARATPERPALLFRDLTVTFGELAERSGRLAGELQSRRLKPPFVAGIHLDRTPEMIVAALAVMKAGGAYLPLDPLFPEERLRYMIEDANAELVLSKDGTCAEGTPVLQLTPDLQNRLGPPVQRSLSSPNSPFCIMYTSGSSGRPKGVISTHYATLNCFYWMWDEFPFREGEVCCQTSSLSFGDSIQEIFGPLLKGVPLLLIPLDVLRNPRALLDLLFQKRVTRLVVVPSLLERLLDVTENLAEALPYCRLWITSGEALSRALAERFLTAYPGAQLINLYGASELSNDVTFYEMRRQAIERSQRIRIGRPVPNMRIYVANERQRLCPVGIPGELWVSGRGVTPGYQSHPELTKERFVPNPFREPTDTNPDHARCYRTGDQVYLRPDGELEFLGRMDSQVKIAGKRIELEEVERILEQLPAVRRAVVVLRVSPFGIRQIVAYLIPAAAVASAAMPSSAVSSSAVSPAAVSPAAMPSAAGASDRGPAALAPAGPAFAGTPISADTGVPAPAAAISIEELNKHVRTYLPDYMIPAVWEIVDSLPHTTSGKVDRRRLPEPTWTVPAKHSAADGGSPALEPDRSAGDEERIIAELWREVLEYNGPIESSHSFFDIGGTSLALMLLIVKMEKRFRIMLESKILFQSPTVGGMAEAVRSARTS